LLASLDVLGVLGCLVTERLRQHSSTQPTDLFTIY
jgi:hypothetical protein